MERPSDDATASRARFDRFGAGRCRARCDPRKMRLLVISAPRQRSGLLANVPTWKDIGVDITASSWRTVMAPKGLRPAQVAYWESVFAKLVQTEDWKKEVAENHWENTYLPAAAARQRLDQEYEDTRQILAGLGVAK